MRYTQALFLAAVASALTCGGNAHAVALDVRYINPGGVTFDVIKFEVDGQPYVEMPSGCPGPGTVAGGPVCVAQIQLGEGLHAVRAQAFAQDAGEGDPGWTVFSNTINVQGAPEPKPAVAIGAGLALLAWWGRRRA